MYGGEQFYSFNRYNHVGIRLCVGNLALRLAVTFLFFGLGVYSDFTSAGLSQGSVGLALPLRIS